MSELEGGSRAVEHGTDEEDASVSPTTTQLPKESGQEATAQVVRAGSLPRRGGDPKGGQAARRRAGAAEMSDALINGLAGAGGGIVAQLLTYPLQTVRPASSPRACGLLARLLACYCCVLNGEGFCCGR